MSAPIQNISKRLDLAVRIAREAGEITLGYFRRADLAVELKSDNTPVTIADRRAEEHLRERISDVFPDDAILGEEFPDRVGNSGYRWILDPIDGTKAFIHGVPLYGTLIGVEYEGESILGVIRIPALAECVYGAVGHGAWYVLADQSPVAAKVSTVKPLANALFLTSEVATFDEIGRRDAYLALEQAARLSRTWGDCYGYLLVATGRAELMVDPVVAVWDLAALKPIVEEAGGQFTDWHGRHTIHSGQAIATNGHIHAEVMAIVQENGPSEPPR